MKRALLLLALVSAAGCGGGGGGGGNEPSFADQANAICRSYRARIARVQRPKDSSDLQQIAAYVGRTIPLAQQLTDRLASLPRPKEDAAEIERFIATTRREIAAVSRGFAAAKAQNQVAMRRSFAESRFETARAGRIADGLGLTACRSSSRSR